MTKKSILNQAASQETTGRKLPSVKLKHGRTKYLRDYLNFVENAPELLKALEATGIWSKLDLEVSLMARLHPEMEERNEIWRLQRVSLGIQIGALLGPSLNVINGRDSSETVVFRKIALDVAETAKLSPQIAYKTATDKYFLQRAIAAPLRQHPAFTPRSSPVI